MNRSSLRRNEERRCDYDPFGGNDRARIGQNVNVTRAFYVKYLQRTLASVNRDESRYRDSSEPGFVKLAEHLVKVAHQTQSELDRVLEEPDGGDYSPDLAEFNEHVLYPKST